MSQPLKKSQLAGNLAGAGVILGIVGAFLGWRANNLEQTSTAGALFIVLGAIFLIAGIVTWMVKSR